MQPSQDLQVLLRNMQPVLHDGAYAFVEVPHDFDIASVQAVAVVVEDESKTLVLPLAEADSLGLAVQFRAAWITLQVHSDLAAAGLTAAVAAALSDQGISCNVIAGCRHDHLFVPFEQGDRSLTVLLRLMSNSAI